MAEKEKKAPLAPLAAPRDSPSLPAGTEEARAPQARRSSAKEMADFLAKVKAMAPAAASDVGRLIFAMDATMSRQPTWDLALSLQADMFSAVKEVGGLAVQLVYFRGAGECRASKWVADADALANLMRTVNCRGGQTQIGKVLTHARHEASTRRVHALVYVGDCMEEQIDELCAKAGELKLLGLPIFLFQEGDDPRASTAFGELARLTGGAHCRFDQGSARQLRELLTAVAAYAAGGSKALQRLAQSGSKGATLLIGQMKR
ncbi:MAG: VWA domain-containing protein [Hyphomicrobiaceae bacterium]|nr:MAG: VWA domain-containing protein [Hyphomicrobiaceae bacterium]